VRVGAATLIVFRKELRDGVRDRRSVLSALLIPLLWPLMIGFTLGAAADKAREAESVKLAVVGPERAPYLVEWLDQQDGVSITPGPVDPREAVRSGKQAVVLVIPEGFADAFARSRPARVELVLDGSRQEARPQIRRVRGLLNAYSRQVAVLRLTARGIHPEVASVLDLKQVEVATAQRRGAMLLSFLPMFVVLAAFVGGLQIAVDTTAGERERGSIEALLVNPTPRRTIVLGKWLAAVVFSAVCVLLTLWASVLVLQRIPLHELGLRLDLGWRELVAIGAGVLPVALLASGVQALVATFARSYKEAQTYLQALMLLPMVPGFVSMVYPIARQDWMIPLPILGQHVLLTEILAGEATGPLPFLVAGLSALLLGLLCVALTARLFHREAIIFGR